jgi:L-amino acid N-acyltransferase YncA
MKIRLACKEDLPWIVEIYNQSIFSRRSTADLSPVRLDEKTAWFEQHNSEKYPIFLAEVNGRVLGWCSLSPYRPGRMALRFTAEISYFIDRDFQRQGLATALVKYAVASCPRLEIKNVFAIVLEVNEGSIRLLERMGFRKWGFLPRVADFDGRECGHLYYGKRVMEYDEKFLRKTAETGEEIREGRFVSPDELPD